MKLPVAYAITVKPVLSGNTKRRSKLVFKTNYCLMQVKRIAEHSAILSTFIKLPFVIKIFVLSIFEWQLKTRLLYYQNQDYIVHLSLEIFLLFVGVC